MRRLIRILLVAIVAVALAIFGAGEILSHPVQRAIGPPPPELRAAAITQHST